MNDPDPVLPLLWREPDGRPPVRRGPKQKASLDEVLDAAIELADADGLAAVSMRGLARALGLGAMTLYTYVPGRDELVVLMVDQVLGRTERPTHRDEVRRRVEAVAESAYAELSEHPWLLEVDGLRAWLGPQAVARYEWQLSAVDGLGLTDIEMDQAVVLLEGIAATAVRSRHAVVSAERRSGLTELEWWAANAEAMAELVADRQFPLASRVGQAAGEVYQAATDPERQFRFALDRVADGLLNARPTA
ncbi:MAG: TetR/AcrR family transcriptional regulator [Nocardioides sp.]